MFDAASHLLAAALGAAGWSATEYLLHRFGAHHKRNRLLFQKEHLTHHSLGNYFAPTRFKVFAAAVTVPPLAAIGALIAGPAHGLSFAVGFACTYLGYEWFHRRLHTHGPRGRLGRALRLHHFHHHFADAKVNHGVTSRVWDRVFGTLRPPATPLRVPRRLAPYWLVRDGELPSEYAADYVLIG